MSKFCTVPYYAALNVVLLRPVWEHRAACIVVFLRHYANRFVHLTIKEETPAWKGHSVMMIVTETAGPELKKVLNSDTGKGKELIIVFQGVG